MAHSARILQRKTGILSDVTRKNVIIVQTKERIKRKWSEMQTQGPALRPIHGTKTKGSCNIQN
jgi:hypothetical protein